MALGKQTKVLPRAQIDGALGYIAKTRHPDRNRVIIPSGSEGGACVRRRSRRSPGIWSPSEIGGAIHLRNEASKGRSGRIIPLNVELRHALIEGRGRAQVRQRLSTSS
jgi:hypothetical protein